MKLFQRRYEADEKAKARGKEIARSNGLPPTLEELPPGEHSWSHTCTFTRTVGYRRVYDSIDTLKIGSEKAAQLRKTCKKLGIIPLFRGDYITFDSIPHRNIVVREFTGTRFSNGIKSVTMHLYFDIEDYLYLEET